MTVPFSLFLARWRGRCYATKIHIPGLSEVSRLRTEIESVGLCCFGGSPWKRRNYSQYSRLEGVEKLEQRV